MGKILRADNRVLPQGQPYSYLTNNYTSGQTNLVVENSAKFAPDQYVLISEFGPETSEIKQIQSVTAATHTITLTGDTGFSHSESTKISVIPFNQVKFYYCTSTAYVGSVANSTLLSTETVQADNLYTQYETTYTSNYAWFYFYNSTTSQAGGVSHIIPLAGFNETNAKSIMDSFLSQLNNKEKKLIDNTDIFSWMSEAYGIVRRQFNLVTRTDEVESMSVTPTARETELNSNFFKIVRVYNETDDCDVLPIDIKDVELRDDINGGDFRYYIRRSSGVNYIGFSPSPTSSTSKTFTVWYNTKSEKITSYYSFVYLPDDNIHLLVNYMLYKASPKLGRGDGVNYRSLFFDDLKRVKEESLLKIESGNDVWTIDPGCNI